MRAAVCRLTGCSRELRAIHTCSRPPRINVACFIAASFKVSAAPRVRRQSDHRPPVDCHRTEGRPAAERTASAQLWIAVLDAGWPAALGSHTALELAGFRSPAREAEVIHLIVQRGHKVTPMDGIRVHESRRLASGAHRAHQRPAAYGFGTVRRWTPPHGSRFPGFACLMVAAAVQQRVTSPAALDHAMREVGQIRHKAYRAAGDCSMSPAARSRWANSTCRRRPHRADASPDQPTLSEPQRAIAS